MMQLTKGLIPTFWKGFVQIFIALLLSGCEREDPTIFSGDVVDMATGRKIPGVTLLFSVYEKSTFLTLPGIIRLDTVKTDAQGHFNLVFPYDERYSRFSLEVLKEAANGSFDYIRGEKDCTPYDCSSFRSGYAYKFLLKIPQDSL